MLELYDYTTNPKMTKEKHQLWFNKLIDSHYLHLLHASNIDDRPLNQGYSELIIKGEQLIELLESELN